MKYLILFLISFSAFANMEIVVTEIANSKVVAADFGSSVTIEKLKQKMIKKKNIDITDATKYTIVVTDKTQDIANAAQEKIDRKTARQAVKAMKADINASSLPVWHKKLLKTLIKELKE